MSKNRSLLKACQMHTIAVKYRKNASNKTITNRKYNNTDCGKVFV